MCVPLYDTEKAANLEQYAIYEENRIAVWSPVYRISPASTYVGDIRDRGECRRVGLHGLICSKSCVVGGARVCHKVQLRRVRVESCSVCGGLWCFADNARRKIFERRYV